MRKLFLHINMSLDGYIDDRDRQMDWHFVDRQFEEYINGVLSGIDGMVFGRVTHELLAQYWPTAAAEPGASEAHRESARWMHSLPKYVISRGGYTSPWHNSHAVSDIGTWWRQKRQEPGRDFALFAGAGAAQAFDALGLVDEYRILLNPVLLGGGTPLFGPAPGCRPLELLGTETFGSGVVVLRYRRGGGD